MSDTGTSVAVRGTICPATRCPYLGATSGSPVTGEESAPCEDSCEWYQDDGEYCLAGNEFDIDAWGVKGPVPPEELWPECPYADSCQWQEQREGPCAPRYALLFGMTVDDIGVMG